MAGAALLGGVAQRVGRTPDDPTHHLDTVPARRPGTSPAPGAAVALSSIPLCPSVSAQGLRGSFCRTGLRLTLGGGVTPDLELRLHAGPEAAGAPYVVLGIATGPGSGAGVPFMGTTVPLIAAGFFDHTLLFPNVTHESITLTDTVGTLDATGRATASYSQFLLRYGHAFHRYWAYAWFDAGSGTWRSSNWIWTRYDPRPLFPSYP